MNNPPLKGEVARASATEGRHPLRWRTALSTGTPLHHACGVVPLPFQGRI